jgi:CHRD domain-containing protein
VGLSVKRTLLAFVVCVVVFGAPAGAAVATRASTVKMTARLTAKQAANLQSVKVTRASGRFTGTLVRHSNGRSRLSWTLRYRHMSSRVTKAELVVPATGTHGAVAVQLCRSCKANAHGVVAPILKPSTKALLSRTTWVVVFTKKNRKGEIRGRIVRARA